MNASRLLRAGAAAALLALPQTGWSVFDPVNDDTDIFLANPSFSAERPNILIILDNTANWNTPFDAEKTALINTLNSLSSNFNVGLMMFTETGSGNSSNDGGYIRFGIRQMDSTNKGRLAATVNSLDRIADKSNGGKGALAMYEAFQYFSGRTPWAGNNKVKTDYAGSPDNPAGALPGNPLPSKTATTYVSPIVDACQKNFIIYISNGPAQDNSNDLGTSEDALKALNNNVVPATIPLTPNGSEGNWADEWARYMANSDCNFNLSGVQNVYTYAIDVGPASASGGQGPGWTALMKSMSVGFGKGKYFPVANNAPDTGSQIEAALAAIFQEVQAVNSVFASTTLPVSVNVRGTNLNQVYIGVFRPDQTKNPRWFGNLKLYKLGVNTATSTLFLADAVGGAAENASTGFISGNAQSFWTASSSFWSYRDPTQNGVGGNSDMPDGDLVEKGGAAQRIRVAFPTSQTARNVYTCTSGTGLCAAGASLSASLFNTANTDISAADMAAYTTYPVTSLSSAGTTATAVLATTPSSPSAFANGNFVIIEGAQPDAYNTTSVGVAISNLQTVGSGISFDYTLAAALSANIARVTTSAAHNIATSDLIEVTGASPPEYNTTVGTDAPATRLSATTFTYSLPAGASSNATTLPTLKAKKNVTSVSGSGVAATASIPGHGYPVGVPLANFSVTGACGAAFNASNVVATVPNVDTVQYTTAATIPGTLCGTPTNVTASVTVTVVGHELAIGDRVTISGLLTNTAYNGTNMLVVAVPSSTQFTYVPTTAPGGTAPTGTATITATRPTFQVGSGTGSTNTSLGGINNGSGGNRNLGSVRTVAAHGASATNWKVTVSNVATTVTCGGATGCPNFNVSNVAISSVTANTFNYTMGGNENASTNATAQSGSLINVDFSRNSFTTLAATFANSTVDNTAGIQGVLTLTSATTPRINSISVQSNATGSISAGKPVDNDATLRTAVINWVRGQDNIDDENVSGSTTDIRASVHGDVLHSRPAVINYNRLKTLITGTDTDSQLMRDSDIYVFYGTNGGMLHAVKGGVLQKPDGSGGTTALTVGVGPDANVLPGTERWSFVAREFFPNFKRLRAQVPDISGTKPKDYFFDGSIGIYVKDLPGTGNAASPGAGTETGVIGDNAGDKVYIYTTMRRGGTFIYAFDVTNPVAPKLLWKKGSTDTDWGELARTFSEPRVARVSADIGNTSNPENVVLIFGSGYQRAVEDINPCLLSSSSLTNVVQKAIGAGTIDYTASGSCTITGATGTTTTIARSTGRGIMVVDAFNGNVIWQAGGGLATSAAGVVAPNVRTLNVPNMTCAIPSDTTVLDKNRDGFVDRIYSGDTCGQVWRADISSATMDEWAVTKIATLSSATTTDIANKRKFLFPPDLVFGTDASGNYTAVLLGSGDREHPFDTTVVNRFYMLKDRDSSDPGNPQAGAPNASSVKISGYGASPPTGSPLGDSDVFDATNASLVSDPLGLNGWKITLAGGEKVVSSATSIAGTVFFNTNQPSSSAGGGACGSNLGIAREYLVGFADAAATVDLNGTGGTTLSDRSTIHAGGGYLPSPVPVVVEIDGKKYQAVISGTSVQTPPGLTLEKRTRAFWYKQID